jgi:hypothetical protein
MHTHMQAKVKKVHSDSHTHTYIHTYRYVQAKTKKVHSDSHTHAYIHIYIHTCAGKGEKSALWLRLKEAIQVLEKDFESFDTNKGGLVDYTEITMGAYTCMYVHT